MAEELVLKYLMDQNRPFNAVNIADALNSQGYKKTQVQKALDSLTAASKVLCVENSKQKIYLAVQSHVEVTPEEAAAEEAAITELKDVVTASTKRIAELNQELKALACSLTLEEAKAQLSKLQAENLAAETKLVSLREGTVLVDPADREKAEKAVCVVVDEWSRRRRIFLDIWGTFTEGSERKPSELKEEIGWDDDKDVGCSIEIAKALVNDVKKAQLAANKKARRQ